MREFGSLNATSNRISIRPLCIANLESCTISRRHDTHRPPFRSRRCRSDREHVLRAAVSNPNPNPFTSVKVPVFPFVCISGQEELKLALLLNVIDTGIGGVLVMGDRGTGKSVAVRALAELLPDIEIVKGDPFNSHPTDAALMGPEVLQRKRQLGSFDTETIKTPLIELPLGATEDRICGTIDVEKALTEGVRSFDAGLLAKANRGILYVDEVNLLEDGIVDVLLDAAASGINTVEREGVSIVHPSKFIMIGSGNPEEGELRPQLIDRFGLSVQIETVKDRGVRKKIVLDRLSYEQAPDVFVQSHEGSQEKLRQEILNARSRLRAVQMSRDLELTVSKICARLRVEGLRGDIVACRAARALAALENRQEVVLDDVERVIGISLNHRLRKDPLDSLEGGEKVMKAFKRVTDPKFQEQESDTAEDPNQEPERKPGSWEGLNF